MLNPAARQAHVEQAAGPAVLQLLRRLRVALSTGQDEVDIPVGLSRDAQVRQPAAAVRAEVARRIDDAVGLGTLTNEQAGLLRERFALDGKLRTAHEIAAELDVGRETMRSRYVAAAEALADEVAGMPLVLEPEVPLDQAERELRVAFALEIHRAGEDLELKEYVDARVRHRLLGHDSPAAPRRGRVEDRRWQRTADRVAAAVETAISLEDPVPTLPPVSAKTLAAIRHWLEVGGQPTREVLRQDFGLTVMFLQAAANGQVAQLEPELSRALSEQLDEGFEPETAVIHAALADRGLTTHASFLVTARAAEVVDPAIRLAAKFVQEHLADEFAFAGYVAAGEHLIRISAENADQLISDVREPASVVASFATKRFMTRAALQLSRGPTALPKLRQTLQAAASFSARRPEGIDYAHACRLQLLLVNSEIAACLAGAAVEPSRAHYESFMSQLQHAAPAPLSPTIDQALRDGPVLLRRLWEGERPLEQGALENLLFDRVTTGTPGTRVVLRRWIRPH